VWVGNDDSSPTKKATGGSLPVDVWSRFMRAAHQGVAVAALPGLTGAPAFALAMPNAASPNPTSEGQLGPQASGQAVRPQPIDRGLDGWFLDRLFGRR
jgi:penicillin-binding protein 1A